MPADRLLSTLLRSLQTHTQQQDTPRILGTAVSLLTTLKNPLNVTLLTSQLLVAPAIWMRPDGLRTFLTFIGVFNSATMRRLQQERDRVDNKSPFQFQQQQSEPSISTEEWARAVIKGADERSPRSRHLLVLTGLLIAFSSLEDESAYYTLKLSLQDAIVKAANLALVEPDADELSNLSITLSLNHAFPYLTDRDRANIDYDRLLPLLMHSMLHSAEGLRSGYFLSAIDADVQQASAKQFNWSASSPSFFQVQKIASSSLTSSLGPLSRLIAHALEHARDSLLTVSLVEDIAEFSRILLMQWRQNKLSEIDAAEELEFLCGEARNTTVPALWKLLRSTLYALVLIMRSAIGRMLGDAILARHDYAPHIATESLHALRNLNFIFSRLGSVAFSQYTFTYLTAIDILVTYPATTEEFVRSITPKEMGAIPAHPVDRGLDLFFLNTSEHFTTVLPPSTNERLLITAATPYLATGNNPHLLPIFEAAHSVMLAVFFAPQNVRITTNHLPSYVNALFNVFPQSLSARQFRLALKNLIKVASPPTLISEAQPLLAATLLELVHERALYAPTIPLASDGPTANISNTPEPELNAAPPLSEQAVLVLTLIDALPSLSLDLLDEWLPLSAASVNRVVDPGMREHCKEHMWKTMINGEMDAERSQVCVAWWTTRGGREELLYGAPIDAGPGSVFMSGGLNNEIETAKL